MTNIRFQATRGGGLVTTRLRARHYLNWTACG